MNSPQKQDGPQETKRTYPDLERLLVAELRQLLGEPPTARTRLSLLLILDRLRLDLARRLVLEGEAGYMADVVEACPNWSREIEVLRAGNVGCMSALAGLGNRILRGSRFASIATRVRSDLRQWTRSLEAIRGREGRLLQEAFNFDVGGEG